jgi:hypothetical protein
VEGEDGAARAPLKAGGEALPTIDCGCALKALHLCRFTLVVRTTAAPI